jgi:SMI1/KNR4 family protein SUKH-1
MYLAKFFHRLPGDDDRELLLMPESPCGGGDRPIVMGIVLSDPDKNFMHKEYPSMADANRAFRAAARELRRDGYVETAHTDYTLRNLLPDPAAKPDWQRALDELLLVVFAEDRDAQARLIKQLDGTRAAREPLYLWIAAHHAAAARTLGTARLLNQAEQALNIFAAHRLAGAPIYTWSLPPYYLEANINDLLCELHLAREDTQSGLAAARRACDISANQYRGGRVAWILCEHFPEHREEAFDQAYRHGEFGGYDAVIAHPAYASYLQQRKQQRKSDKAWRWSTQRAPTSETALRQLELTLGVALPPDYRDFLAARGRTELLVRLVDDSRELRFFAPSTLIEQRDAFLNYVSRATGDPTGKRFHDQYGVWLRDLVPVAEPTDVSSRLLINLGKGAKFGWCYLWSHENVRALEAEQPSFRQAIAALTQGIERRDASTLRFLDIYVEE